MEALVVLSVIGGIALLIWLAEHNGQVRRSAAAAGDRAEVEIRELIARAERNAAEQASADFKSRLADSQRALASARQEIERLGGEIKRLQSSPSTEVSRLEARVLELQREKAVLAMKASGVTGDSVNYSSDYRLIDS